MAVPFKCAARLNNEFWSIKRGNVQFVSLLEGKSTIAYAAYVERGNPWRNVCCVSSDNMQKLILSFFHVQKKHGIRCLIISELRCNDR